LRRLQRKLARQQKGSNRRARTKSSVGRPGHEKRSRKNWIEQTTTELVGDYDLIAIEDLRVKNMVRSAKGTVEQPGTHVAQKRVSTGPSRLRAGPRSAAGSKTRPPRATSP